MICTLCPRNCRAEREDAQGGGVCGVGTMPKVARAALHMWEEPCISGTRGSGAVFFSGCGLKCIFCQNEAISHGGEGETVSIERLAEIFCELEAQGAHNINLVTAAQFVPAVIAAGGSSFDTVLQICKALGIKALGDDAAFYLTENTEELLTRYAMLDDYGRHTIDAVMRVEYERCTQQSEPEVGRGSVNI